ncbi:MAG: DnaJ domain-containing protein [Thermodesulfobacteriota bacterium]|nr:DnaJ domain-containing protein [Thermodesulfobacteriota bacterium]
MQYRQHNQPGCGGCLLIIMLILLVTGGWSAVGDFISMIFFTGIMGIVLLGAAFFGFSWYVRKRVADYEATQTESHNQFVFLLVNILVKLAKSDGHFTKSELQTMTNFFQYSLHYNQDQMYWVKQLIKEARDSEQNLEELLTEFRRTFAYEPRLILLELIYQILYTKVPVNDQELKQARQIAAFLQINEYDQRTIEAKYRYGRQGGTAAGATISEEQYYAVLGLKAGADFVVIKQAYRKLSKQYHPDKVAHLGEEFKAVAEEKMKEINVAYDFFEKKFNGSK